MSSNPNLFPRLIKIIKQIWSIPFVRFLFVGGINTLFGYAIYSLFILLHVHYAIASLIGTILGICFNFFTTGTIVFKNNNPRLIFKFLLVYGINYFIGLIFLTIFSKIHMNLLIAGAIPILPLAVLGYFLNKKLVFRTKTDPMINS